jgi:hypothetical protein
LKKILFLLTFFTIKAHAIEAVVTVLEAPLFKEKSLDAPVVQYLRKGDYIKLHPSIANDERYDHLAPSPEKYQELKKKVQESPDNLDPLFKGNNGEIVFLEDQFIPTVDRLGKKVYVLSEHIFVYFNDKRELNQNVAKRDPTDYRLQEPLPKRYPLHNASGYRGQLLLGAAQAYNESYSYPDNIKAKGYSYPVEVNVNLLLGVPYDNKDRFFFGAAFRFKTFKNEYSFLDFRTSKETYIQVGGGPLISYDVFKGSRDRINVSGSILINPFNYLAIVQNRDNLNDTRNYRGYSLAPRFGLQYHRKDIIENLDFVLGTSLDTETPATYKAIDGGSQADWWKALGADSFRTQATFAMSVNFGLQAAY